MRSAETLRRLGALAKIATIAAAALIATGCATVSSTIGDSFKAVKEAVTPAATTAAPAASASAPVTTAAAATQKPALKAAPSDNVTVSLATQRAYDVALRLLRANRLDEAERGFRAIAQANPDLGGPHVNLGVIYRQQNKLTESASELELAVKANPNQPVYFNQLGVTYRQLGKFDKAREAYERAIELDANYAAPTLNLGILYDLYIGDRTRALELYDRYLALSPSGDPAVTKWVAELKNRKQSQATTVSMKEKA